MTLLRSIATIGGFTMISRIIGFVRDILIAAVLGAGPVADAFFVAFKFPNLFRRLFAEGAFNLAFVPMYAGAVETEGKDKAQAFAEQAFSILFWSLLAFVVLAELAMPWIMMALVPGFMSDPETFGLAVTLTRITFPYLLFISLVSLMAGVLNSLGKFAAAAATPIILNLCLIGAILGLAPFFPSPGHALAWGVAGAGLAQFAWLYGACVREGVRLRVIGACLTAKVGVLLRRMIPVAAGAGIYQINLVVDMIVASLLPSGSISFLFYADRVTQLPLGVVGVAVGTALLPLLSRQIRAQDATAAAHSQNRALEFALLLTLPAAVALAIIADPVIGVLFERGSFGPHETSATGAALAVYAFGLPAYVLIKVLAPGFFAREDTLTPVKIGALAMLVNVVLNIILMEPFKHVGIAMATVASSWLGAGLLALMLKKRGQLKLDKRLRSRLPRMLFACVIMGLALWGGMELLESRLAGSEVRRIPAFAVLVFGGAAVFAAAAQAFGAIRLSELRSLTRP